MSTYLLRTFSSNEDYDADFYYALIYVTEELARSILNRRTLLNEVTAIDLSAAYLAFFSDGPFWLSSINDKRGDDILPYDLSDALYSVGYVKIPDGQEFTNEDKDFRTDCIWMHVGSFGVEWLVTPKNTSLSITTASLPYSVFEEALGLPITPTKDKE